MFTSIGKFFISVALGISTLLGIHHVPAQPTVTPPSDQMASEAVVSTSSSQKATPAVQTTKSSSIFQKIEALVAPSKNDIPAPAPVTQLQKPVAISNTAGEDCSPKLTITPATLTPTVPQTDTFTIKMVDSCGFQNVYLRTGTGSSSVDYAIPSSSIDSSGTTAIFTRDIVIDSAHVGKWPIYMAAAWSGGIRTQVINLNVAEDPAVIAAKQKAAEAAAAAAVTAKITVQLKNVSDESQGYVISWTSKNITSCTLNSSPVLLAATGSEDIGLVWTPTTYSIKCIGGDKTASSSITVQPFPACKVPPHGAGDAVETTGMMINGKCATPA